MLSLRNADFVAAVLSSATCSPSSSPSISCSDFSSSIDSLLYLVFLELCSGCSVSLFSLICSRLLLLKSSSSFFSLRETSVSMSRPVILFSSLFRRFSSLRPSRLIFWTVLSLALYSCSCKSHHPLCTLSRQKNCRKQFPGSSPAFVLFCFLYFLIVSFSDTKFFTLLHLIRLRSHQRIQHQRIIKFILKRDNGTAIKDQSLTFSTVGNIRKLMW